MTMSLCDYENKVEMMRYCLISKIASDKLDFLHHYLFSHITVCHFVTIIATNYYCVNTVTIISMHYNMYVVCF